MKTDSKLAFVIASMLSILILLASLQAQPAIAAKAGDEYWRGYRMPDGVWTKGNLSPHKDYVECEWVPYQLVMKSGSKVWQDPDFGFAIGGFADVGWSFWSGANKEAIYIDMLGAFHYKWDADLTAYASATPLDHGDSGSAVEFELGFKYGPAEGWYPFAPSILNRPGVVNSATGTYDEVPEDCANPEYDHFFRLTPGMNGFPDASEFADGGHENIVVYFQAHLALDILWKEGQEAILSHVVPELAGTLYLGNDGLYGTADDWTCPHRGSSQYQGSASHFFLQFKGIGDVNIPIPIAEYPSGRIQGHKYVHGVLFDGWEITLTGELVLAPGLTIPYNPPSVFTGMGDWDTGYFEFTGLVKGDFTVQEEDRLGLTHVDIDAYGDGTVTGMNIAEGWVSFTLPQRGTQTVDFYNTDECIVYFYTEPSHIGNITVDGKTYFNGDSDAWKYCDTFTAVANAPEGWVFDRWEVMGNIEVLEEVENTIRVHIVCGGSIKAYFKPPTRLPSRTTTELIPSWCEGPMYLGHYITDKVTVRPLVGDFPVPTGTVELWVEFPAYSGTWIYIGTQPLVGYTTEFIYTPPAVGTYRFQAFYSGDSNYEPSESNPDLEVLVVYPPP